MSMKEIKKLIKKWEGWYEKDADEGFKAYFPSPWHAEKFRKEAGL